VIRSAVLILLSERFDNFTPYATFLPQSPQRLRKERKDLSLRTLRNLCALCGSEKVAHQVTSEKLSNLHGSELLFY